eukprot:03036.XXX_23718_22338_1 [CDS] Oithona nana genome sequencing.
MGENREMTSTARIPPKATYVHLFLGESFCDGAQSRHWQDFAFIDLLVCVPDPYWFCFHRGFTWTCATVVPTELHCNKLNYGPNHGHLGNYQSSILNNIAEQPTTATDLRVCRLNGRLDLNLRDHLGPDEMPPKASKCVHIDAKFVSSLQSLAASRILETFPSSTAFEDLSIPKALAEELALLSKLQSTAHLRNF